MTGNTVPQIYDQTRMMRFRTRALRQLEPGRDFLLQWAVDDIVERLGFVSRKFENAVELIGHTGLLADALSRSKDIGTIARMELLPAALANASGIIWQADETDLKLKPADHDLIVSPLSLHMVNDLPGALIQINRALKPDGLFLAVMPGGDTLHELRDSLLNAETQLRGGAALRIAPFADIRDLGALLQRTGFALPVTDMESLTVRYDTVVSLMHDLRGFGMSNCLKGTVPPLTRELVALTEMHYRQNYADPDGRLRATFTMISMSGWAPHESQQQPLRPGSAKQRLSDALGVSEGKLKR